MKNIKHTIEMKTTQNVDIEIRIKMKMKAGI
jgi:hypothetical protein